MFINPKTAITEGWITHPACSSLEDWVEKKFISPNAIDFTLDALYGINHHNIFTLSEDSKQMRGSFEIAIANTDSEGREFWTLSPHETYDGLSNMFLKLPKGVACNLIVRSTFNRNGIYLTSGLYDSKFEGPIGFAIHNNSGMAMIQRGCRFGQIMFISSDSDGEYVGGYNHQPGTHWSDDK